jgi:choice-of-anchor B domain-containing protein
MFKKFVVLFTFCSFLFQLNAQTSLLQLAHWDDNTLPEASPNNLKLQYSGCWGMAVNGHEYAILGGAAHILIFDVTDPSNVFLRNKFDAAEITIWREFKSYQNRLYAVSDGTSEGMMIFDFSGAPDTIQRTYWSTEFIQRAHTITLDTTSGHIYLNGGSAGSGIILLDVTQNPDQPQLVANIPQLEGGYIHDSYVRNDTLYASSGYNGLFVYDFKTDPQNPITLGSISTGGYNHNSWLTSDGKYTYYTEEIPRGRPVQIVDLQGLTVNGEMELIGNGFLNNLVPGGTEAIPHNVYIKDSLLFNSQYEDGLLVYNISDPENPILSHTFDTHPENSVYNGYYGNWGNYPWLPSGNIIAGDMQNGLYLLKINTTSSSNQLANHQNVSIQPNPASNEINVQLEVLNFQDVLPYRLVNNQGKVVQQGHLGTTANQISVINLAPGFYVLELLLDNQGIITRKVVIQR